MISLAQSVSLPISATPFFSYVSLEALIILQWVIIKHIQEATGESEIAPKDPDPKHYNSTNFPTTVYYYVQKPVLN